MPAENRAITHETLNASRAFAVKALQVADSTGRPILDVIVNFIEYACALTVGGSLSAPPDYDQVSELARGATSERSRILQLINNATRSLPEDRQPKSSLKAVLEVGTWELVHRKKLPTQAIIADYALIGSEQENGVQADTICGILQQIACDVRSDDLPTKMIDDGG